MVSWSYFGKLGQDLLLSSRQNHNFIVPEYFLQSSRELISFKSRMSGNAKVQYLVNIVDKPSQTSWNNFPGHQRRMQYSIILNRILYLFSTNFIHLPSITAITWFYCEHYLFKLIFVSQIESHNRELLSNPTICISIIFMDENHSLVWSVGLRFTCLMITCFPSL